MSQKKYSFNQDFQQEILQFTVTDLKYGFKAISLFESHYFSSTEHSIIAEALKRYYERKFTVPSKAVLKEELRSMLKTQRWSKLILPGDKEKVFKTVNRLYLRPVRNPESVYEGCSKFSQYTALRETMESIDLEDFESYERLAPDIQKAVKRGSDMEEDDGILLLRDVKSRVVRRADSPPGHPTPFWQLNMLFNNGGTSEGNVIVLMGEEKKFKTGTLINVARGYLKMGKVILIADFENGENALSTRIDQSLVGTNRKGLLSGPDMDSKLLKMARMYKRFGGELAIKRFPAGASTIDVQRHIDKLKEKYNLDVDILIADYPDVMGDTLGTKSADEAKKISQVYLDLKNLGEKNKIKAIFCPSHITRDAAKTTDKKRRSTDASKSQDKSRHADMTFSLEQTEEEKAANLIRLELVNQRDGPQDGRVYFWIDFEKQRLKELSKEQRKEIDLLRLEQESNNKEAEAEMRDMRNTKRKKVSNL